MPRRLLVPSAFLVLLAAACESTAPGPSAGMYVLRDIADTPPPFTYHSGVDGTYSVVADTIELDGVGGAHRTYRVEVRQSIYQADTVYGVSETLEYRLDGARIEIGYFRPCPSNAICVANDTGYLLGRVLTLSTTRTGQLRRWTYERIMAAR